MLVSCPAHNSSFKSRNGNTEKAPTHLSIKTHVKTLYKLKQINREDSTFCINMSTKPNSQWMYNKCEWIREGRSGVFVDSWHHEPVLGRPRFPWDENLCELLQVVHVLHCDGAGLFWGHTWKTKTSEAEANNLFRLSYKDNLFNSHRPSFL